MKRITQTIALLGLLCPSAALFAAPASIVVNATATVSTPYIVLGDIATITPSPMVDKTSAQIAATIVGRAALPGQTRMLDLGEVYLRLRANGINPSKLNISGAQNITVTEAGAPPSTAGPSAQPAAPPAPVIKYGDSVDVVVIDGPVIVDAKAIAAGTGAVGQTISVRRDGVDHLLTATVLGAGEVQLEE